MTSNEFFAKNKMLIIGLTILIMLIIIGVIIYLIVKKAGDNSNYKAPPMDYITNPETGQVQVVSDPLQGYDPKPLANSLKAELEAYCYHWFCTGRCKVTKDASLLTDNQLKAVAMEFKKISTGGKSLIEAISANYYDGCDLDENDYSEIVKDRLTALGMR